MVKQPDLLNAPMTHWISYFTLFDYVMNHVPAQSHAGIDGLSRQRCTPEDSEDEDAEEYLDKFMGSALFISPPPQSISLINFLSSESLNTFRPTCLDNNFFQDLLLTMQCTPRTPYALFRTTSIADDLSILSVEDPIPSLAAELRKIKQEHYNPSEKECGKKSLVICSLLSIMDDFSYTGREFEHQKVCTPVLATCSLGEEVFTIELSCYRHSYMTALRPGMLRPSVTDNSTLPGIPDPVLRTDNRDYEDVPPLTDVMCTTHSFGVKDKDLPEMWQEIITYLKSDILPTCCEDPTEHKSFIQKSKNYFLHDGDCLWKFEFKGKMPCLVIIDLDHCSTLIAEAHNDVGHQGCDATYKTLSERFFWPTCSTRLLTLYDPATFANCIQKTRPIVTFSPTWNSGILQRFDLDTVHMPDGFGGMSYLLQATDPAMSWVEACAVRRANSESWAKFLYKEVYCRFRSILLCLVDGGSKFKGAVEILFKQYGVVAIVLSLYHPEGNGHAECSHQTLVNSIFRACGKDTFRWPLYVHAGLWAMCCSTSQVTGYPPYFLLYGRHPFFGFDFADRTWDTLDWHTVSSTEDLLALQMQQILQHDKKLVLALEQQKCVRQRAVDDFNHKHKHYLSSGYFIIGPWVLMHETWLDSQMGNKGALHWTGPYIIHRQLRDTTYQLRELDGTVM